MSDTTVNNTLSVGAQDTKDVISLVIAIAKAFKASQEDGVLDYKDIPNFLPVITKIGPAVQGIENLQVELRVIDEAEATDLKAWIHTQMDGLLPDAKLDQFIQDCFSVVLDFWIVIRNYFFLNAPSVNLTQKESAE